MAPSEITRVTGFSGPIPRALLTPKGTVALRRGATPRRPVPATTIDLDRDPSGTENEIRPHPQGPILGILSADPLLPSPPGVAFATEEHALVRLFALSAHHRDQRTPLLPRSDVRYFIRLIPLWLATHVGAHPGTTPNERGRLASAPV